MNSNGGQMICLQPRFEIPLSKNSCSFMTSEAICKGQTTEVLPFQVSFTSRGFLITYRIFMHITHALCRFYPPCTSSAYYTHRCAKQIFFTLIKAKGL